MLTREARQSTIKMLLTSSVRLYRSKVAFAIWCAPFVEAYGPKLIHPLGKPSGIDAA